MALLLYLFIVLSSCIDKINRHAVIKACLIIFYNSYSKSILMLNPLLTPT